MRKFVCLLLLMTSLKSVTRAQDVDINNFNNPPKQYSIIPFWFLNGDLQKGDLLRQMKEMKEKKVYGFVMHPRMGMVQPYFSREFWDRLNWITEYAKELGMQIWIYDEYNWPSGIAAGKVIEENPDFRDHCLNKLEVETSGQSVTLKSESGRVIGALAVPVLPDGILDTGKAIDLSKSVTNGALQWKPEANSGLWKVFLFSDSFQCESTSSWVKAPFSPHYVDVLNPAAIKRFIELTHDEYKKRFGKHFGKTMTSMFTDEPALYKLPAWTTNFLKEFKKRKKYELLLLLPLLFHDSTDFPRTARVRCDYHDVVTQLYEEAFFKQIHAWCKANGVKLTGHLLLEEGLLNHALREGNYFQLLQWMDMPGMDYISGNKVFAIPLSTPKIVSSVAHLHGKKKVMSESYAGFGWAFYPRQWKWATDWLYVNGVNVLVPHAFFYTTEGEAQFNDNPPSFFFQNTFWRYYSYFSDYVMRLSYMLSQGNHVADVAMLYPIGSLWAKHKFSGNSGNETEVYDDSFETLTKALRENSLDVDYVDEETIQKATIMGKTIRMGEETFQAVVLPPTYILNAGTQKKLKKFAEKGGVIAAFGWLPEILLKEGKTAETLSKNNTYAHMNEDARLVSEFIRKNIQPDVTITPSELSSSLLFLHRREKTSDIYFFTNRSEKELHAAVKFRAKGAPYLWHPETGEEESLKVSVSLQVKLVFEPYESYFVVFKRSESPDIQAEINLLDKPIPALNLHLDKGWFFHREGKPSENKSIPLENWTKQGFQDFSGTGVYENTFTFSPDCQPQKVRLYLGRVRHVAEVWVNEKPVGSRLWEPYRFDIAPYVKRGENNLKILVTNSPANEARMKKEFPLPLSHLSPLEQDYWKALKLAVQWTYFSEAALSSGLLGPVRIFWECL